jgi:hypothetical protein
MAVFPHLAALSSTPRLHGQYANHFHENVILVTLASPSNRRLFRQEIEGDQ